MLIRKIHLVLGMERLAPGSHKKEQIKVIKTTSEDIIDTKEDPA